jgi:hypothetical protein
VKKNNNQLNDKAIVFFMQVKAFFIHLPLSFFYMH